MWRLDSVILCTKLFFSLLYYSGSILWKRLKPNPKLPSPPRTVLVIGASFAGYHAAKTLAEYGLRVVLVERNTHFQFSWVLPRFSAVHGDNDGGNEAFIPYRKKTGELGYAPGAELLHDEVVELSAKSALLRSGADLQFDYLVMATGASAACLPGRVGCEGKPEGMSRLAGMRDSIEEAQNIVVVGGGAQGVEVAGDIAEWYSRDGRKQKSVVLVHSREVLMNSFGPLLVTKAKEALERLGVEVVLGCRVLGGVLDGEVELVSGRKIRCDLIIWSTGQKPNSELLKNLSPKSVMPDGRVDVLPTLQVRDPALPNIFAAGDIVGGRNSRSAINQAELAVGNIVAAIQGKPMSEYETIWWEGGIDLTLGIKNSMLYMQDGKREMVIPRTHKDISLRSEEVWKFMGQVPYEDTYDEDRS